MLKTRDEVRNLSRSLYSSPEFRNHAKLSSKCWQHKLTTCAGGGFFTGPRCSGTETFYQLKSRQKKNSLDFQGNLPAFPCPQSNESLSELCRSSHLLLKSSGSKTVTNSSDNKNRLSSVGDLNCSHKPIENCISKCIFYIRSDPNVYMNKDCCIIQPRLSNIKGQYLFAICDSERQSEINNTKNIKKSIINIFNYKLNQLVKPIKYLQLSSLVQESIIELQGLIKSQQSKILPNLSCVLVIGDKLVCGNTGRSKIIIGQKTKCWEAKQIFQYTNQAAFIPLPSKPSESSSKSLFSYKNGLNVQEYQLTRSDKFIIIANEAFWTYISNQEAVEIISTCWIKGKPNKCLNTLIKEAVIRWKKYSNTVENIAVIVAFVNVKY